MKSQLFGAFIKIEGSWKKFLKYAVNLTKEIAAEIIKGETIRAKVAIYPADRYRSAGYVASATLKYKY